MKLIESEFQSKIQQSDSEKESSEKRSNSSNEEKNNLNFDELENLLYNKEEKKVFNILIKEIEKLKYEKKIQKSIFKQKEKFLKNELNSCVRESQKVLMELKEENIKMKIFYENKIKYFIEENKGIRKELKNRDENEQIHLNGFIANLEREYE